MSHVTQQPRRLSQSCVWALSRQWGKMSFLERQCLSKKKTHSRADLNYVLSGENGEIEQLLIFLSSFLLWLKSFLPVSHLLHLISFVWVFQVWRVLELLFRTVDDGIHWRRIEEDHLNCLLRHWSVTDGTFTAGTRSQWSFELLFALQRRSWGKIAGTHTHKNWSGWLLFKYSWELFTGTQVEQARMAFVSFVDFVYFFSFLKFLMNPVTACSSAGFLWNEDSPSLKLSDSARNFIVMSVESVELHWECCMLIDIALQAGELVSLSTA